MIKYKMSDIDVLLSGLLVFSIVVGGLHHVSLAAIKGAVPQKAEAKKTASEQESKNPWEDSTLEELQELIQPLIESESVEKLVEQIAGLTLPKMIPLLQSILENKQKMLDRDDRVELLLGVAATYKKSEERNAILDLILNPKFAYLQKGNPLIYVAATSKYPAMIPVIKEWYAKKVASQANAAELTDNMEKNALEQTVKEKKLKALEAMQQNGVAMTQDRQSLLLHDAVDKKAGVDIVTFLLKNGAEVNSAIEGYTPLLTAVKNSDLELVKLLGENGADVNLIADNSVGNPLQMADSMIRAAASKAQKEKRDPKAASKTAVDIKEYLIEKGAQY